MKKLLVFVMILAMLATVFTGCGSKESEPLDDPYNPFFPYLPSDGVGEGSDLNDSVESDVDVDSDEAVLDETVLDEAVEDFESEKEPTGEGEGLGIFDVDLTASEGLEYTLTSSGTYAVSGIGSCTDIDIVIRNYYNGRAVSEIAENAFADCFKIKTVKLGNNIRTIREHAFARCVSLYEVKNTSGLQTIETGAFGGCRQIMSFVLPSSLTYLAKSAFSGCDKLEQIYNFSPLDLSGVGESTKHIGTTVSCISTSILDPSIFEITTDGYVFRNRGTGDYPLYHLVNYIGTEINLVLPETYKDDTYVLGSNVFSHLIYLKSVVLPSNIKEIPYHAFYNCINLKNVGGMEHVTKIQNEAFMACSGLKSIELGENLNSIGYQAFANSGLTRLVLPESLTKADKTIFSYCVKLVEVYDLSNINMKYNTSATSSSSGKILWQVESIHKSADSPSILEIDDNGYVFCCRVVSKSSSNYTCRYYLVDYIGSDSEVVLPEDYNGNAYSLNRGVFQVNDTITGVVLPRNIEEIPEAMFYSCENLRSITYQGTVAEWEALPKGGNWSFMVTDCIVYCTDGEIAVN